MRHREFRVGTRFACGGEEWRCTDIGLRTVVAVRTDYVDVMTRGVAGQALARVGTDGWLAGPPYAAAEHVFDENDIEGCEITCAAAPGVVSGPRVELGLMFYLAVAAAATALGLLGAGMLGYAP